jgi:oligopeptide transport system substrate-binding protein
MCGSNRSKLAVLFGTAGRHACFPRRPVLRAFFCLFVAILSSCTKHPGAAADHVLRISQRSEPADLDPATASLPDEFFIIRALGEGLFVPSSDNGAPRPGLAASCDVSPDGLAYTFHLRENLRWSSGEPLTADDLVASFRRTLTPATAAPKAHLFFAVKNARAFATGALADFSQVGFRAPDERTLEITLEHPTSRFLHYVASGPWIPVNPRVVARHGRAWTKPETHVGCGPFVLAEWRPQQRIVVRRNPHYHAAASVHLDAIEFLRLDNDETEERAFRAAQVDVTLTVPKSKIATYAREHPGELHRAPLAETRFLAFNTRHAPLSDPRVRRALALAIDRPRLIDRVLLGGQEAAHRFLSPALRFGTESVLPFELRHDPDRARRLLAEAGFPDGRNFPRLELTAWSPSQVPVLETLQAMWRDTLGIEIAIATRETKVHLASLVAGTYDLAFMTTLLDVADPVAVLGDFATGATNNFPHWHSDEFDRLIAEAVRQPGPAAQSPLLARAEELLLEAAPVAPLYFNSQHWLMSPRVHGWRQDGLWHRDYTALRLDENP